MTSFASVLEATEQRTNGARIISEQHDVRRITPIGPADDRAEYAPSIEGSIARANLNVAGGRVSMFSALELPWHALGTLIDKAANSREAAQYANLAPWDLQKIQQYVDFQDRRIETDQFAIVRGDTGQVLASVGRDYQIVTNEEMLEFADALTEGGAVYETAGALGRGERVWLLASVPELTRKIAGSDEVQSYVMFAFSHGLGSIKVFPTEVRTVCQNTYNRAYRKDSRSGLSFRHTKNVKRYMDEARESLGVAKERCAQFLDQAELLAATKVDNSLAYFEACLDDVLDVTIAGQRMTGSDESGHKNVLDAVLAVADVESRTKELKRYERAVERRAEFLNDILERYESERCNGNADIAGTLWSATNAVSEAVQHGKARYHGDERTRRESRMDSILEGRAAEATEMALERALSLAV